MLWLFYTATTQGIFYEETESNRVSSWKRDPRLEIRDMLGGTTPDVNNVGYTGWRRQIIAFVKNSQQRSNLETLDGQQGTLKNLTTNESWSAVMSGGGQFQYELLGFPTKDGCQYQYRGTLDFVRV